MYHPHTPSSMPPVLPAMTVVTALDEKKGTGILLAAGAFALFSVLDVIVKLLAAGYAIPQVIFLNSAFALIPILGYAALRGGLVNNLRTRRIRMHMLRAAMGVSSGFCTLYAFSRMPIADVYALAFSAPLWITLLSVPILKERVGWRRWTAVGIGFLGILIILRPGAGMSDLAAFAALGGALFYSLGMLISRFMRGTESSVSFAAYSSTAAMLVMAPMLPFVWQTPTPVHLAMSAIGGLLGGTALICLLTAFRLAPASLVAPFQYTQLVWGVIYGYAVFGHVPDPWLFLGGGIVICSGLFILYRETVLGRQVAGDRAIP